MFMEERSAHPPGSGPQYFSAEDDDGDGKQIPLGPALIALAVLASLGGLAAVLVWLVHKFVVPIPFW